MKIEELNGKRVCMLGYGREGQAMVRALEECAPNCTITIADKNASLPATRYPLKTGPNYLKDLDQFDVLIKSPGMFPQKELEAQSSKLTTSTQIFLDSIADSGATVIGVTGSKGKSTTSSLIHAILQGAGKSSLLIGNIGEPAIAHLKDAKTNTFFVQELSSYQLMDLTVSPEIAVVTSFFPEHLDYHGSLENYLKAKKRITHFQSEQGIVFFNATSDGAKNIANESRGKKVPVIPKDAPVQRSDTKLKGNHNLENIALAWKVAEHLGITKEDASRAIKDFIPLPHRLESLGIIDGIEWVNDSISTTPESAIAAIDALGDRVKTMILGGQDRGYDFTPLAERIASSTVETVILLPDSGKTIGESIKKTTWKGRLISVSTMEEAVDVPKKETQYQKLQTRNSPIVLLSPASPSYGHFKNFEERGEKFGNAVGGKSLHS